MAIINIIEQQNNTSSNNYFEDISSQISFEKTVYRSTYQYKPDTLEVFLNGILIKPKLDYAELGDFQDFEIYIPDGRFQVFFHSSATLIIKYQKAQ